MPARRAVLMETGVEWLGPIDFTRVRDDDFTDGMRGIELGVYVWGGRPKASDDWEALYVGQAMDPCARQHEHLAGSKGRDLEAKRRQKWELNFWCGSLLSDEFCDPGTSEKRARTIMTAVERALILSTKPHWNGIDRTFNLDEGLVLVNAGRRPPFVKKTIRLKEGRHA